MSVISMKQLLEAGVHFGHQTRRWNPKMAPYIYTERNGIYIIDLQKSVGKVDEAYQAVSDIAAEGGTILFVGTKKQAQDAIKAEAERCGMFYVNERWLGGMLTNFKTIKSRVARLKEIERMAEDGTFDVLPKKEVIQLKKEWEKLEKNPSIESNTFDTGRGMTLCYDAISGRYFKSDQEWIRRAVNNLNERLNFGEHISLNEFYDEVGLEEIFPLGETLGWCVNPDYTDRGQIQLKFTSQLDSRNTPCLVVGFANPPRYDYEM